MRILEERFPANINLWDGRNGIIVGNNEFYGESGGNVVFTNTNDEVIPSTQCEDVQVVRNSLGELTLYVEETSISRF